MNFDDISKALSESSQGPSHTYRQPVALPECCRRRQGLRGQVLLAQSSVHPAHAGQRGMGRVGTHKDGHEAQYHRGKCEQVVGFIKTALNHNKGETT